MLLNGTPVGSRRYEEGLPLAVWEVSGLLRRGRNRLTAELRSGRGLGGFLLTLETAEGVLLATGPEWRIVRRYDPVLLNPELPLAQSEPPRVWAFGATGRWGAPEEGAVGPLYGAVVEDPAGRFAVRARALESSQWYPMGAVDGRSSPISERVIFDWGREVFGYPSLIFGGTEGAMALIWAGLRPPGATGPVEIEGMLAKAATWRRSDEAT